MGAAANGFGRRFDIDAAINLDVEIKRPRLAPGCRFGYQIAVLLKRFFNQPLVDFRVSGSSIPSLDFERSDKSSDESDDE